MTEIGCNPDDESPQKWTPAGEIPFSTGRASRNSTQILFTRTVGLYTNSQTNSTGRSLLKERIQPFGFDNLTFQVSATYELALPDARIDRAFWVSVLDQITDKMGALREVRRVLKPDALLGVHQRLFDLGLLGRRAVLRWCQRAEFEQAASFGTSPHYLPVFRPAKNDQINRGQPAYTC
jgi:SAM-dependent methyltransferase